MAKLLEAEIVVVQNGEEVPYTSLTQEEREELATKLNQRAIKAVANARGYNITFYEGLSKTGTA